MATPPNPFEQQAPIVGVQKIIAVGSGKGGVGKSTVAANLAVALVKAGLKVGLLDADIYGPSQPRLFGALAQKPEINDQKMIVPIERYGVKLMSIGFLVEEDLAVVWRGPMLFKAMNQLIREVAWGELDVLLVDLPPGTGDVQLSLVQKVPVHGAVIISTPQNVALADVKKSIDMFERTGVRILGLIENMVFFKNPTTGENIQIFPRGELHSYIKTKNIKLLAELPIEPAMSLGAELGIPIVQTQYDSEIGNAFAKIAAALST